MERVKVPESAAIRREASRELSAIGSAVSEPTPLRARGRADYGLDAPGTVRWLALVGVCGLVACPLVAMILRAGHPFAAGVLLRTGIWTGGWCGGTALWMAWFSRFGKLRQRDRLLDLLPWRGDEQVLDVGCGRGLLLVGAAQRAPLGQVTGIDLWQQEDQAGNRPDATLENARREGVGERVEVRDGDARMLPFPDGQFDHVVSSYCLHNIRPREGRATAVREMVRVLKPGGHIAIADLFTTAEYVSTLRDAGLEGVTRKGPLPGWMIPTYLVFARKP